MTAANRHDSVVFDELVDALLPIAGKPACPRRWPGKLHADKAYDIDRCRHHLKGRGITPRIARKGIERNDRLGRHRWVVERTYAWFAGMGKLRIRFGTSNRYPSGVALDCLLDHLPTDSS